MMDNRIEEMAKVLCINDNFQCNTCPSLNKCFNYSHAKKLYNEGYRKIPEGAVVVPDMADKDFFAVEKTEWDKMVQGAKDIIHEREDKARKETAEKFAERVKMAFYYEFDELIPSIMADKIDEIAKGITEGEV